MDHDATAWRADWGELRTGRGCVLCPRRSITEDEWGIRVFTGQAVDGFVWKTGMIKGYVIAIWNGRHVAEPTALDPDEAATYWEEVTKLGRAVEAMFSPAKMNYLTLGNNVPHLHTHIVPRHWVGDPNPNSPVELQYLDQPRQHEPVVHHCAIAMQEALSD